MLLPTCPKMLQAFQNISDDTVSPHTPHTTVMTSWHYIRMVKFWCRSLRIKKRKYMFLEFCTNIRDPFLNFILATN